MVNSNQIDQNDIKKSGKENNEGKAYLLYLFFFMVCLDETI